MGRKLQGMGRSHLALLLLGPLLALYLLCSLLQNLDPSRPHFLGSYISWLLAKGETEGGREKHTALLWLCLRSTASSSVLLRLGLQLERPNGGQSLPGDAGCWAPGTPPPHLVSPASEWWQLPAGTRGRVPVHLVMVIQLLHHDVTNSLNSISSVLHSLGGFCFPEWTLTHVGMEPTLRFLCAIPNSLLCVAFRKHNMMM